MRHRIRIRSNIVSHVLAACIALLYAWQVSQTIYVKSGLQFIAPLLMIMMFHLVWVSFTRGILRGFSQVVFKRSLQTTVGMTLAILLSNVFAPMPAFAAGDEVAGAVLRVVFCAAVIAVICGIVGGIVYAFVRIYAAILRRFNRNAPPKNETRFFDFGSMAMASAFLVIASLEGVPGYYDLGAANRSTASYFVDQSPVQIWRAMEQTTSPDVPIPVLLKFLPQPVDVEIDEGTELGAMRKIGFQGREGKGSLTLRVTERTKTNVVFEVISDTTPIANWVTHKRLIYDVRSEGDGTRLSVTLEYERLLAPAWFFSPAAKRAAYLAMDVLARDVKSRAEG